MSIDSKIREIILNNGYITIDSFMRQVLSCNSNSYYLNKDTIGTKGDFITAPEISQLFGEVIGLWCIDNWQKMGSPEIIDLIELGPGRGLLMRDILRVAKLIPKFYNAIQVKFVEINPNFIHYQKVNLSRFNKKIKWLDKINNILQIPSLVIANEFFDALPINQYIKIKELWFERVLSFDLKSNKLKFDKIPTNVTLNNQLTLNHNKAKEDAIIEKSSESLDIMKSIINHLKNIGGASLIIDYGYNISNIERVHSQYNSTLQAIKNHKYHPLFENLGEADLSAHVDFNALIEVTINNKIGTSEFSTQREFLIKYGILLRADLLKKDLSYIDSQIIEKQVDRLISNDQMGGLFKVLYLADYNIL